MIFGRYRISCDDFGDCHDEIAVARVDFIGRQPICGLYLQQKGCFRALSTGTATSSHRSLHRWSQRGNQGLKVMCLHPILYPTMQLSIFFHRYKCVLDWFQNVGSCGMSNVLGLIDGFNIRIELWLRCSRGATREENNGRIWIDYYIIFISDFFSCVIWGTVPNFNIIPLPFAKKTLLYY